MSAQNDREYLERRQLLSAEKARAATDRGVAWVHGNFAKLYARRLDEQPFMLAE